MLWNQMEYRNFCDLDFTYDIFCEHTTLQNISKSTAAYEFIQKFKILFLLFSMHDRYGKRYQNSVYEEIHAELYTI